MKIYFISPIGKSNPLLFNTFIDTFEKEGHEIVNDVKEATVIFFDMFSGLGNYDQDVLEYALENKLDVVAFDETDFGGMSKERWFWFRDDLLTNESDQFIWKALYKSKIVYFMRKMDKKLSYPVWVYPFELIMYPDHDFTPVTKEELFNRPNDVCFIGNTSPTRENMVGSIKGAIVVNGKYTEFKVDSSLGKERIPHSEWLQRHRNAKLFIEACGGGFSSERQYQLITIAPMLRNRNSQLVRKPFTDLENCVEINELSTAEDMEKLKGILSSPDRLYNIYLAGIEHMKKYYTSEYRSKYILNILNQNGIC